MLGPLLQKEKIPIGTTGLVKPQKVLSNEIYPNPLAIEVMNRFCNIGTKLQGGQSLRQAATLRL